VFVELLDQPPLTAPGPLNATIRRFLSSGMRSPPPTARHPDRHRRQPQAHQTRKTRPTGSRRRRSTD